MIDGGKKYYIIVLILSQMRVKRRIGWRINRTEGPDIREGIGEVDEEPVLFDNGKSWGH